LKVAHGQEMRQKMLMKTAARRMFIYWGNMPDKSFPKGKEPAEIDRLGICRQAHGEKRTCNLISERGDEHGKPRKELGWTGRKRRNDCGKEPLIF